MRGLIKEGYTGKDGRVDQPTVDYLELLSQIHRKPALPARIYDRVRIRPQPILISTGAYLPWTCFSIMLPEKGYSAMPELTRTP